jgi:hypothetical protein
MAYEITHDDVVIPLQFQENGAFGPHVRQANIDRLLDALKVLNMDVETVSYTFMDFLLSMFTHASAALADSEQAEQMIYDLIALKANKVLDALEDGDKGDEPILIHLAAISLAFHNILVGIIKEMNGEGQA